MAQQKSNKPMLDRPRAPKKPLVLPTPEEDRRRQQQQQPLLTPDSHGDDPFAGMNSSINYQQEIERLKALVPKVDGGAIGVIGGLPGSTNGVAGSRKRMSPRPKSYDQKTTTVRRSPPTTRPMSATPAPRSVVPEAPSSSTTVTSPVPTPRSITPPKDDPMVITEEEKLRFLQFMRNWTGSWKAWDDSITTHYGGNMDDGYSLWARQMPWTHNHTWQEPA
ncbi:hypothetical protein LRAMOSA06854 [Lichtheimia ramosa]|uniref:Uncharacterized protein n=1 Tax=Lichtheimia ramosa TaxID=688394 RepID=A0A077WBA0_9FUNG|nr:hypothetical protein LRAMOSA06854 [Lichtheimia ramosa]